MKKITNLLLVFVIVTIASLSLSACSENASGDKKTVSSTDNTAQTSSTPATNNEADQSQSQSQTQTPAETVDPENAPKFEFEKIEHDFGTVVDGEIVEHTFKFTNVGKSPLIIESTSATCGCTVPEHTKEPVAPGKTGSIKVAFNSAGKPGVQNKAVTITANSYPKINKVYLKGEVKAKPTTAGKGPVKK